MTAASTTPEQHLPPAPTAEESVEAAGPEGNPALVGVPTFMVGSFALALNLVGFVNQGAVGAPIAIIAVATGIGQVIACVWAARLAQNAVASVFAIFGGFWLSYGALVFGLLHNWYGLTAADVGSTVKTFLLSWLILIVILTLVGLRLPLAFTAIFVLVDFALLFVLLAYVSASDAGVPSSGLLKLGGVFVFAFALVGAWVFADAMNAATGGKNLPLGPPLIK